jgi:hypothetical protein
MVLADFDIEKLAPLFSYLLTKLESDLYPFALVISLRDYRLPLCSCDFLAGLQKRPLHRLPIGAPGPLIPGCVGWFFESVVG